MFNGLYPGDLNGQAGSQFGYGMDATGGYGQEQDPYSVSYYQAAAAAQYRSLGWDDTASKQG